MEKIQQIKQYADYLRLTLLRDKAEKFIHQAQLDKTGYLDFTHEILEKEVQKRQNTDLERRLRMAKLPRNHDLDLYSETIYNGLHKNQLKELRELLWLEQAYNLILMGPSGTGKTYIASGLINDAVKKGYKAYFTTMEDLVNVLKMKEMTSNALNTYNRYLKAHLIAIDDIMLFQTRNMRQ